MYRKFLIHNRRCNYVFYVSKQHYDRLLHAGLDLAKQDEIVLLKHSDVVFDRHAASIVKFRGNVENMLDEFLGI